MPPRLTRTRLNDGEVFTFRSTTADTAPIGGGGVGIGSAEAMRRIIESGWNPQFIQPGSNPEPFFDSPQEAAAWRADEARRHNERAEQRLKDAKTPTRVTLVPETANGVTTYFVRLVRGDTVLDEYRERSKERALSLVTDMRINAERSETDRKFRDATYEKKEQVDARGSRVAQTIQIRRPRIDRRAKRPADDVVTEDGLLLTINEEHEDEIEVDDIVNELIEELAAF